MASLLPAVSLQANKGDIRIGPIMRPRAAADWPNPFTVPLVAGYDNDNTNLVSELFRGCSKLS